MKNCNECRHCVKNWREVSQLPLCQHPLADPRVIWAMYAIEDGHCKNTKNFEPIDKKQITLFGGPYNNSKIMVSKSCKFVTYKGGHYTAVDRYKNDDNWYWHDFPAPWAINNK